MQKNIIADDKYCIINGQKIMIRWPKSTPLEVVVESLGLIVEELKENISIPSDEGIIEGSFVVHNAISYMEKHYNEPLSLAQVADEVYISRWHLSKLLNKYTKKSFYDNLNEIRVNNAINLMKDPKLRISDISHLVGYTDVAHFSKIFKKIKGNSANNYRNTIIR